MFAFLSKTCALESKTNGSIPPIWIPAMMRRLTPAILVIVTILSYSPVFWNGFVYDDHFQLERNPYVQDFRHLKILLTKDVWHFSPGTNSNNYRPLHMISYLLIYKMFGLNAVMFHAVGLALFVFCVLLIWRIYSNHLEWLPAFAGGLVFATHPVHVESVAWIGGYPDLLTGVFLFLSFLFYVRAKNLLSLLAFLLAVLSKETALVFPLILIAHHVLFGRREDRSRIIRWCVFAGLILIGYWIVRVIALGSFIRASHGTADLVSMLFAAIPFAGLYAGKMLFPVDLNAFYHIVMPLTPDFYWPGVVLFLCFVILLVAFRKNRVFLFGGIWFLVFLLPALFVRGVSPVLFAERYLFLPSAGFILAAVSLPWKRYVPVLLIGISLLFAGLTFSRSLVWRTDLSLWEDTVEKSPLSATVQYNVATAYLKQNDFRLAAEHYRKAIEVDPKIADSYYNLAICEYRMGNKKGATDHLRNFLKYADPKHPMRKDAEQKLVQLKGF